ncbi:MAG TPA: DUF3488 and transglutaminase-like domain-containing protein [Pilimelia sp.]|nr:DUF3488 and transglutaminase-like domain-containing protein [Pilimelia sp.]
MTNRRHMGWIAGAATLLAATPLSLIFESWTWFGQCLIIVALIAGAATLTRWLRGPLWAQVLAMGGTLLLLLTWFYPSGEELVALIPTPGTISYFGGLMDTAVTDMRSYGVPVPDRRGLLFLTVLGVGGVAILVDVLTVGVRRPALAGLPMLAIYSVPVAVYIDSVPPWPFVIGAVGFLWLLVADNVDRVRRFGRRFTGDGRDVDVWEPSPLAAAGRRLAVVGVLLAVIIPIAVPGMGSGLLTTLGPGGIGDGSGKGNRPGIAAVDLFAELSGRLNQSRTEEQVKVTTNDPNPYYLRFAVADQVNSRGVQPRQPTGQPVGRGLPDPRENARSGVTQGVYRARVEILPTFDMPMLPIYLAPVNLDKVDNSWLYDREKQMIFSFRSRSAKKKYEFEYVRSEYTPQALRDAPSLSPDDARRRNFTSVPPVREINDLVTRLTRGKQNDYDRVRALFNHFSRDNGFEYSLDTERGTSGNDMVDFLTNKKGFCEQYAAALTWLVRAADIPARVAFGFTKGSSRNGDTYTLTNRNLHAWTEVYFDGFGWVPFDATPTTNVAGSVSSAWAPDLNVPEESNTPIGPTGAPVAPGPNPTSTFDPRLDAGDPNVGIGLLPRPNSTNWPWFTISGVILLLALLAVPAMRRAMLRRRRQARAKASFDGPPVAVDGDAAPGEFRVLAGDGPEAARARADAHAAWDELIDTMIDFKVPVDPAETPRATAERLAGRPALPATAADGARLLGRAEERARYAREPIQVQQFGTALRGVRGALKAEAGRRTRLAAALMPPSVLLRWRLSIVDRSTRTVLAGVRMREALARLSPRRLLAARASR